jgi:hypothetical protein
MRSLVLCVACGVLSCGCGAITDSLLNEIINGYIPGVDTYEPPAGAMPGSGSRLAFVASGSGDVSCFILDSGGSDPVVNVHGKPTGIAAGAGGDLFISTEDTVWDLDPSWSALDPVEVSADVVGIDGVAADAGTVVVAARTDEGGVVLVYDEVSGDLVGESAPVGGVVLTSVAVADGVAFAVESPSGEIVSFDLEDPTPARTPLAAGATSAEPVALVVGHTGNLFVADAASGNVEEIDIATGAPVGTLFSGGPTLRPVGMAFDPSRKRYLLLTADDRILEIDRAGAIVATHESDLVEGAAAITFLRP